MSAEHAAPASASDDDNASAGLGESLRLLQQAGRAGLTALLEAGRALRELVAADLALARRALLLGTAFMALALILAGSAWLLVMAALVAALQAGGLSWLAALAVAALLNLAGSLLCGFVALRYFRHTRLQASRRQLAQLAAAARSKPTDAAASEAMPDAT